MMRIHIAGLVPILTVLTAASVAIPGRLSGQELDTGTSPLETATPATATEFTLHDASEWTAYANRLLAEADELPAGGTEAVEKIQTAAMIQFHAGEPELALELIVDASEAALQSGLVAEAAHALIDGAWIATAMERPNRAIQLAERAIMLSIAPQVSETDRMEVLRRVQRPLPVEANAG